VSTLSARVRQRAAYRDLAKRRVVCGIHPVFAVSAGDSTVWTKPGYIRFLRENIAA
jgi:hypothetical protein